MTKLARLSYALPALLGLLVVGCSSSDDAASSAPTLTDVTLDKTELTVGTTETVKVTITYADPDGDIISFSEQQVAGNAVGPENQLSIADAAGKMSGTKSLALQLGAPQAGEFTFQFWVTDKQGNQSPKVMKTITAK